MKKPKTHPRLCDLCGKPYYRSNSVRLWVTINPGHRLGWAKSERKICTRCLDDHQARETLREINPKWKEGGT